MKHIYIVTFEIHRSCKVQEYVFPCEANNAKEAVEQARKSWMLSSHQFHIHAVRSRVQDDSLLRVHPLHGDDRIGPDCLNAFSLVGSRTWRVNGINQYGTNAGLPYWM